MSLPELRASGIEPRLDDILLCGSDCVRCGACFGDAGNACAFEGASVPYAGDASRVGPESNTRGAILDEASLAFEVAEVFMRRGFPPYAARGAAEAAVEAACEAWSPCRSDGLS